MDIEEFKKFLKEKVIIINFFPGTCGNFLYSVLCMSDSVNHINKNVDLFFDKYGGAHLNKKIIFKNFHGFLEIERWKKLNSDDRILFLKDNFNSSDASPELYNIVHICSPNNHFELCEVFDRNKIITIGATQFDLKLVQDMFYNKVSKISYNFNFPPKLQLLIKNNEKYKEKIIKKNFEDMFNFFLEKFNNFEFDDTDFIITVRNFFDKDVFYKIVSQLEIKFNISLDKEKVNELYDKFISLNSKYIEDID